MCMQPWEAGLETPEGHPGESSCCDILGGILDAWYRFGDTVEEQVVSGWRCGLTHSMLGERGKGTQIRKGGPEHVHLKRENRCSVLLLVGKSSQASRWERPQRCRPVSPALQWEDLQGPPQSSPSGRVWMDPQ